MRLVTEGLGIKHLRLVIGNSMGGMHTWVGAVKCPDMADVWVPMACQPTEMSGRNWLMRRMLSASIRQDPEWMGGNDSAQPRSVEFANLLYGLGTNGGNQACYKAAPFTADANNFLYQWEASRDHNPTPGLERIRATRVGGDVAAAYPLGLLC